jgi:PKD repeat protein
VQRQIRFILFVLTVAASCFAGTSFKATTTLKAETSNNTSAADSFVTQTNGNLGATNVSKVSVRSLLYAGSTAKIYAHLVVWFGFGSNMDVGYTSSDPTQVQKQVVDMISRGIDGAIIDWYGRGTLNPSFINYDQATQVFMQESELHPNFNFALMPDGGALKTCSQTAGCDVTQTLINDLTYAYNTYENSPAYLHYNNRPVVYFFGMEFYSIDWARVRVSVPGNPLFIFRNTDGFNYAQSNGAFAWVEPETVSTSDLMGLGYMSTFDNLARSLLPIYSNVAGYKGFDDSLAAWGKGRLVKQQCGQTWLQTIALSGSYFSATQQMLGIQLVTWNDYEEGTEFESGIDNCVAVSASAKGTVVSWSITGQSGTLDHYTVFASQDGQNLMWLADVGTSTSSLDLAPFGFNPATYTIYVKAVGKPSLTNKMSAGVPVTIVDRPPVAVLNVSPNSGKAPLTVTASTAGSTDPDGTIVATVINFGDGSANVSAAGATHTYNLAGTYTVTATITDNSGSASMVTATVNVTNQAPFQFAAGGNTSATVTAGQTANYGLTLDTKNSGFVGTVSVSCSGAPVGVACSVSPGSANFASGTVSVPITVTAATTSQARLAPMPRWNMPLTFAALFAGLLCSTRTRKRRTVLAALALAVLLVFGVVGCGGAGSSFNSSAPHSPTSATLTVTGTSGTQSTTATLTLIITH